ncbi:hypothetical protein P7C73_g2620, partial [Tremellales sp. Uapishka_1]
MSFDPIKSLANVSLVGQNRTAVIVGATTGIGAAVARALARKGCKRIIAVGRNQPRGEAVIKILDELAPPEAGLKAEFVQGDVATTKGMKVVVEDIVKALGGYKVDYLILTQNGIPTGTFVDNGEGLSKGYAVQALSRFAISYLFTVGGYLASGAKVLSICNPGISLDDLSADDLSLKNRLSDKSRYTVSLFIDQSKRDSSVIDSAWIILNEKYPEYKYLHVHPGLVKTEDFDTTCVPFPINYGMRLGLMTVATTPDQFVPYPLYILIGADADEKYDTARYFNRKAKPIPASAWASKKENREAAWAVLKETIGEK